MRLPDFIIIGAPKAATTWLSTALATDSRVFLPAAELHYFNRNLSLGDHWYASQFVAAGPEQLIGEKSASYLADCSIPKRISALLPRSKLIVQLRNPVERAYSDYCMLVRRGEVDHRIDLHLDPDRAPIRRFLDDGLYARHLASWIKSFPRNQIFVLLYDDVRGDPHGSFERISEFLELPAMSLPTVVGSRVKDKETPMLPLAARRLLAPLKGMVEPWRQTALMRHVHRVLARPMVYPSLSETMRARMTEYYADDVAALELLLDRPLDAWRPPPRRVAA